MSPLFVRLLAMERLDTLANSTERWRLLIIDDQALWCAGMAMMFRTVSEVGEVAVATQAAQAIRIAKMFRPDLALVDAAMPAHGALDVARRLMASRGGCRVVFLDDVVHTRRVQMALRADVWGYWTKNATFDEIVGAIRTVIDGHPTFCPEVAAHLIETPTGLRFHPVLDNTPLAHLTTQELELLIYLTDGLTVKQCAEQTQLSPSAVNAQKSRLMRKLDVRSIIELVKLAAREGLTDWSGQSPPLFV